jgi:hypothetical protein
MQAHTVLLSATSLVTARASRSIKPDTSSGGRSQFSEENANTVNTPIPRSAQALTQRRKAVTPCL